MYIIYWGSLSDRFGQTQLTDMSPSDFARYIWRANGPSYGVFSAFPLSEADYSKAQIDGIGTITKAQVKLNG